MANTKNEPEEIYLRYFRLMNGDEIIAGVNHPGHFSDFPKIVELYDPLKFEQMENIHTQNITFMFYDWIPCTDFKNIKIQSDTIIAITTLAKDMKELYRTAVKKTEENRQEWRNAPLDKKISNTDKTKTALQDLLSIMPEVPSDLMDAIFGEYDEYYNSEDDIIRSMLEKKKSTIH